MFPVAADSEELDVAPVCVPATRPAMVPMLNIPVELFTLLLGLATATIILTKNPLYLIPVPAVWWGMRQWVKYDYNAPRICLLWFRTKMRAWDAWVWGGSSPASMPIRPSKHPRGIYPQ